MATGKLGEKTAMKWLAGHVYVLQHFPRPTGGYLVRMVGPGALVLDFRRDVSTSTDILGQGDTFEEAAEVARAAYTEASKAQQPST
jgi:hypothetical protein